MRQRPRIGPLSPNNSHALPSACTLSLPGYSVSRLLSSDTFSHVTVSFGANGWHFFALLSTSARKKKDDDDIVLVLILTCMLTLPRAAHALCCAREGP